MGTYYPYCCRDLPTVYDAHLPRGPRLASRGADGSGPGHALSLGRRAGSLCASLLLGVQCLALPVAAAGTNGPSISLGGDGTLAIAGSADVPRYAPGGRWTELPGRSSARFVTRHFLFMVPNGPPALELYVAHDLTGELPDGVFEMALVRGFLSGFGSKAGLSYAEPAFDEVALGAARVKRCRAELSRGEKRVWLYAHIFVRQPSLTFLTVRPQGDAGPSIEAYLREVRLQ